MARYVVKRLLWLIPVIIGVITIVFMITALTPGDPVAQLLGKDATEEMRENMRHELGLDQPLVKRWFDYVVGIFTRFDFGLSYSTRQPIRGELLAHLPVTILLAAYGVAFGVVLGIPLGIVSSLKQYTWIDSVVLVFSVLMVSIPNFWLALMLLKVFAVDLQWLPSFGLTKMTGWVLPVIVAGLGQTTNITRITRSSMLEVMRQDYIRTVRAKGQKEGVIVKRHMLRNAMIPVITSVGSGLGNAIGGNMALETVFALPGLGNYVVKAISARNNPSMLGGILLISIMFTIINLLVDLAYVAIDPRLKTQLTKKRISRGKLRKMLKEQGAAVNG